MITGKAYRNGNLHFTLYSEATMACEEHTADACPIALDEVEASRYWASGCVPRSKSKFIENEGPLGSRYLWFQLINLNE